MFHVPMSSPQMTKMLDFLPPPSCENAGAPKSSTRPTTIESLPTSSRSHRPQNLLHEVEGSRLRNEGGCHWMSPHKNHLPPALSSRLFITASRLKVSAFCRGGYSLKVSRNLPT